MDLFLLLVLGLLRIYSFVLMVRVVLELIRGFSRSFRPPRWFYLFAEPVFVLTDPPVKALRKLIPSVRLGNGMSLDLSILVLFFIIYALLAFLPMLL